ncbi:MAG: AAA family ATPase [Candidatus Omnitrophica bacterium]|nr:AAA family ATPase [Candidatus Omnitrophota bacterium]
MKFKNFVKITAILVTVSFLQQSTFGYAQFEYGDSTITKTDLGGNVEEKSVSFVPSSLATIKRSYTGDDKNAPGIIHIQDAHCVYPCQERINTILEHLEKDRGIKRIFLEGGSGRYDLTVFRQIADRELRREVSEVFMKEGVINAAEYFAANSDREIELIGVEDPALYMRNLGVFRETNKSIADETGLLEKFKVLMKKIASGVFSEDLAVFYSFYEGHKTDKIGLAEYIMYLSKVTGAAPGMRSPDAGNIAKIMKISAMEKAVDFRKAEKERTDMLDHLFRTLPNSIKERLLTEMVAYKKGERLDLEFNEYLAGVFGNTGESAGVRHEELDKYIEYLREWSGVDSFKLMEEIPLMENEIKKRFAANAGERTLVDIWDRVEQTEKILGFKLVSDEYVRIKTDTFKYTFGGILEDMRKAFAVDFSEDIEDLVAELGKADRDNRLIKNVLGFYEYSFERDGVFIEEINNAGRQGNGAGDGVSVFMTGGFHTGNICSLLEKNGMSYVSVIPKFDNEEGSSERYFGILAGKREGLVGGITAAMSNLQVPTLLDQALGAEVWGKGGIGRMEAAVYVQTLVSKGYRVEIYDDVTGETLFSYGKGGKLIRCARTNFPREVHERFIAETEGDAGKAGIAGEEVADDANVNAENVGKVLKERVYLRDEELEALVSGVIDYHSKFNELLEGVRKAASDPARFKISIREIKRFSDDFKRIFLALVASGYERTDSLTTAIGYASRNIYMDMLDEKSPEYQAMARLMADTDILSIPGIVKGNGDNLFDRTYAKVARAIDSGIPALFIKDKDALGALERAIKKYSQKPGVKVVNMECTPASDSAQLIGGFMPKGRVDVAEAYKRVGMAISGKAALSIIEILAELLDKKKEEVTEKERKDFTEIYDEGKGDEGLIIAAAMVLEDPKSWRNKLVYEKGLLARIIDKCKEDKDTTYIFNIENIEALPGRIRAQLNAFLLTGELRVPGAPGKKDRKLIAPKNLRIIASMSDEAVLEDGAFYDRFLRKKVAGANEDDFRALAKKDLPEIKEDTVKFLLKFREELNSGVSECSLADLMGIVKYAAEAASVNGDSVDQLVIAAYETGKYFDAKGVSKEKRADHDSVVMTSFAAMNDDSSLAPGDVSGVLDLFWDPARPGSGPPTFAWGGPGGLDRATLIKILRHIAVVAGGKSEMTMGEMSGVFQDEFGALLNTEVVDRYKGKFGDKPVDEFVSLLVFAVDGNDRSGVIVNLLEPFGPAAGGAGTDIAELMKVKNSGMRYDRGEKKIIFDIYAPGLKINKDISDKLERYISDRVKQKGKGGFSPDDEDGAIRDFFMDELDYFIGTDEKRMLSAVARSMEYGNGVIRIEGATGAGKTYTAELLSRIMDFGDEVRSRFYSEPVNKETKLARFLGYFRADKFGYYSIDQTTPFLDILKYGGVAAVSEMNTSVKDEYAKLAWWFIQFARGDREIFLNEYPRKGENGAISPSIKRHPKALIIIDVNPEDYEGRGKFPRELIENTPSVYVDEKMNDLEHIKKVTRAFLKHIDDGEKKDALVDFIAGAHVKIFDKVKEANENGDRYPPLSYRELARVTKSIPAGLAMNESLVMAEKAVNKYYIKAFVSEQIKSDLKLGLLLWSATEERDEIIKDVLFGNPEGRSPPVLVTSSSDENPFEDIDSAVNMFKEENPDKELYRERVRVTWFDDEFKLFGGFLPISIREKASAAAERLKVLLADAGTRDKANGIYRELQAKSAQPVNDLPEDISGLGDNFILSLSEALDALRSGREWTQALRYENGIIPRLIDEAERERKAKGKDAKIFIIELENIHRIKPGLAVAFNSILQEGYYYDPASHTRKQVPANLKFVATSVSESPLPFSVAEESRWVRLKQTERVFDPLDTGSAFQGIIPAMIRDERKKRVEAGMPDGGEDPSTDDLNKVTQSVLAYLRPYFINHLTSSKEAKIFVADFIKELTSIPDMVKLIRDDDEGFLRLISRSFALSAAMSFRGQGAGDSVKKTCRGYFDTTLAGKEALEKDDLLEDIDELVRVEAATFHAFNSDRIVLYEGPPGGGKTDMAIDVARRLGLKDYLFSCHNRVHTSELLGTFSQRSNGDFYYTGVPDSDGHYPEADFLEAMTHGGVYIFDEGAIGKRAQELLSVLSVLARGEKLFMLNEIPGYPPKEINVHKDFHIIITMNPPEETVGREPLPLEVYDQARKIWINNGLTQDSYRRIIRKFLDLSAREFGITLSSLFGSDEPGASDAFADALTGIHKTINSLVGKKISLSENVNLHLVTLRDMKAMVKDMVRYSAKGANRTEAFRIAVRNAYIDQFNRLRDRPGIADELGKLFRVDAMTGTRDVLAANGINIDVFLAGLIERELDKRYLDINELGGDESPGAILNEAPLVGPIPALDHPFGIDGSDIAETYEEPEQLRAPQCFSSNEFMKTRVDYTVKEMIVSPLSGPAGKTILGLVCGLWNYTLGRLFGRIIPLGRSKFSSGNFRVSTVKKVRGGADVQYNRPESGEWQPLMAKTDRSLDQYLGRIRASANPFVRYELPGNNRGERCVTSLKIGGREHLAFIDENEHKTVNIADMSRPGLTSSIVSLSAGRSDISYIKAIYIGKKQYLAVCHVGGEMALWDLSRKGKEKVIYLNFGWDVQDIAGIDLHGQNCIAILHAYKLTGRVLSDGCIRVIDLGTGEIRSVDLPKGYFREGKIFSENDSGKNKLFVNGRTNEVYMYDLDTKKLSMGLTDRKTIAPGDVSVFGMGKTFSVMPAEIPDTNGREGVALLDWDSSVQWVYPLELPHNKVKVMAEVRSGEKTYLVIAAGKGIVLWDVMGKSYKSVEYPFDGHIQRITALGDTGLFAVTDNHGTVRIWDIDIERHIAETRVKAEALERGEIPAGNDLPYGLKKRDLYGPEKFLGIKEEVETGIAPRAESGASCVYSGIQLKAGKSEKVRSGGDITKFREALVSDREARLFTRELSKEEIVAIPSANIVDIDKDASWGPGVLDMDNIFVELGATRGESLFFRVEKLSDQLERNDIHEIRELRMALDDKQEKVASGVIDVAGLSCLLTTDIKGVISLWDLKNDNVVRLKVCDNLVDKLVVMKNREGDVELVVPGDNNQLLFLRFAGGSGGIIPAGMRRVNTTADISGLDVIRDDKERDCLVFAGTEKLIAEPGQISYGLDRYPTLKVLSFTGETSGYITEIKAHPEAPGVLNVVKDDMGLGRLVSGEKFNMKLWGFAWKDGRIEGGSVSKFQVEGLAMENGTLIKDDIGRSHLVLPVKYENGRRLIMLDFDFKNGVLKGGISRTVDLKLKDISGVTAISDLDGDDRVVVSCDNSVIKMIGFDWDNGEIKGANSITFENPDSGGDIYGVHTFRAEDGTEYLVARRSGGRLDLWDPFIADKLAEARDLYDSGERSQAADTTPPLSAEALAKANAPSPMPAIPHGFTREQLLQEQDWHGEKVVLLKGDIVKGIPMEDIRKGDKYGWYGESYEKDPTVTGEVIHLTNGPADGLSIMTKTGKMVKGKERKFKKLGTPEKGNTLGWSMTRKIHEGELGTGKFERKDEEFFRLMNRDDQGDETRRHIDAGNAYIMTGEIMDEIDHGDPRKVSDMAEKIKHDSEVNEIKVFKCRGREIIVTTCLTNFIRIWDIEKNKVTTILGHNNVIFGLELLERSDKVYLVTGSSDNMIKFWALNAVGEVDRDHVTTLHGHSDSINDIRVIEREDGVYLVSASEDKTVKFWKLKGAGGIEFSEVTALKGHSGQVTKLEFFARDKKLYMASGDRVGAVKIWAFRGKSGADMESVTTLPEMKMDVSDLRILECAGKMYLAAGEGNGNIKLWGFAGDAGVNISGVTTVRVCNNGFGVMSSGGRTWLVTGGSDAVVKLLEISGKEGEDVVKGMTVLKGHGSYVTGVYVFEREGKQYLATGSEDKTFIVWDPFREEKFHEARAVVEAWERSHASDPMLQAPSSIPEAPSPMPDIPHGFTREQLLLEQEWHSEEAVLVNGDVSFDEVKDGKHGWFREGRENFPSEWQEVEPIMPDRERGESLDEAENRFYDVQAPRGNTLGWSFKRGIKGGESVTGTVQMKAKGYFDSTNWASPALDVGEYLASGNAYAMREGMEPYFDRYDSHKMSDMVEKITLGLANTDLVHISFDWNGRQYIVSGGDAGIKIWDISRGKVMTLKGHAGKVTSLQLIERKGKKYIASGGDDNDRTIKLWGLEDGEELGIGFVTTIRGHSAGIISLRVIGDKYLVSGSNDLTVKLWEFEGDDELGINTVTTLKGHSDWVRSLEVIGTPKGILFASGDMNGKIKLWSLTESGEVIAGNVLTIKAHGGCVQALKLMRYGEKTYLVSGSWDKSVKIWELGEKDNVDIAGVTVLKGFKNNVLSLEAIRRGDRTYLATGGEEDGMVKLWSLSGEAELSVDGVTILKAHTKWVSSIQVIVRDGKEYLTTGSGDDTLITWDPFRKQKFHEALAYLDAWERKVEGPSFVKASEGGRGSSVEGPMPNAPSPLPDRQVGMPEAGLGGGADDSNGPAFNAVDPGMDLPEDRDITEARYKLRSRGRAMLICEPGTRERVIVDEVARLEKFKYVYKLEGRPSLAPEDLIGSKYPVLEEEKRETNEEFVFKKGFLTRHMLTEEEHAKYLEEKSAGKDFPKKLLVIYNIDAIGEKARASLNNLLLNGYLNIPSVGKLWLPDNVEIIATMRVGSQQEFSSAFPNRMTKGNMSPMEAKGWGASDFAKYCRNVYGFDKYVLGKDDKGRPYDIADEIELLYDNIRSQEVTDRVWPSRMTYGFTVKDALTHAEFTALAIAERKKMGLGEPGKDELMNILVDEAMRVYGFKVRQFPSDYDSFVDSILKMQFSHKYVERAVIRDDVKISAGKLRELSGIPISPGHGALGMTLIERNYRLTLVGSMVGTMSAMIRGLAAGKVVSFTGDTGAAKTTMAVALARMTGVKDYVFSMHKDVKEYDLTGAVRMTDKGRFTFEIMEFAKQLEEGNTMLIVDEANIKPEILWLLSGIARGEKQFTIERPGDKPHTFNIGENVYVVFTMNPEAYGGGRGAIPIPLKEDIFNIWVPDYYEYPEMARIVTEFFGGMPELANITEMTPAETSKASTLELDNRFFEIKRLFSHLYARMEVEDVVNAIYDKGYEFTIGTLYGLTKDNDPAKAREKYYELKRVEEEIMYDPKVRGKMLRIRTKVALMEKYLRDKGMTVSVNFSLFTWWSQGVREKNGKKEIIVNVPLYELVDKKDHPNIRKEGKSDKVIAGLIIHELRHYLYSPKDNLEWRDIGVDIGINSFAPEIREVFDTFTADPKDRTVKRRRDVFQLWNALEDVRIDLMERDSEHFRRLKGAQENVDEMIKDMFKDETNDPGEFEKRKKKAVRAAWLHPHAMLRDVLFRYGYTGEFGPYFGFFDEELKKAVQELTGAMIEATQSSKARMNMSDVSSAGDFLKERRRASGESVKVILEKILPKYLELAEESKKRVDEEKKKKQGGPKGTEVEEGDGSEGGGDPGEGGESGEGGAEGLGSGGKQEFLFMPPELMEEMYGSGDENSGDEGQSGGKGNTGPMIISPGAKNGVRKPGDGLPEDMTPHGGSAGTPGDDGGKQNAGGKDDSPDDTEGDDNDGPDTEGMSKANRSRAIKEASSKINKERLKGEPINQRLSEVGGQAKQLAEGLINIFNVPEETEVEESAYGRIINMIRIIMKSMTPFDEEVDTGNRPDLALGMTADLSGSMKDFFPAIKKLSAIFISSFQRIGKKADFSVTLDGPDENGVDHPHNVIDFGEKHAQDELNGVQNRVEKTMAREGGGGIHAYSCLEAIVEKHKRSKQKNKLEVIFTDAMDTEGMESEREEKFREAEKLGVSILVVGFRNQQNKMQEVFGKHASYILVDRDKPEAIIGVVLNAAKIKARTGKIPKGNIGPMFDQKEGGMLVRNAMDLITNDDLSVRMKTESEINAMRSLADVRRTALYEARMTVRQFSVRDRLEKLIARSRDAISDLWRNNGKDIVVMPDLLSDPSVGRIARGAKDFDKKFEQTTVPLLYKYADGGAKTEDMKKPLTRVFLEAIGEFGKGGGRNGILVYFPGALKDTGLLAEVMSDDRIAPFKDHITVIYGDYTPGDRMDIVSHIILAKALLNYNRYKKGIYGKEMDPDAIMRLLEYLKLLVDDKKEITESFITALRNGAILKIRKLDVNDIAAQESLQTAFWKSV